MNKMETPELELVDLENVDVITTSAEDVEPSTEEKTSERYETERD